MITMQSVRTARKTADLLDDLSFKHRAELLTPGQYLKLVREVMRVRSALLIHRREARLDAPPNPANVSPAITS